MAVRNVQSINGASAISNPKSSSRTEQDIIELLNNSQRNGSIYNPVLGNWSYVSFILNILSIFLSLVVITVVVWTAFRHRSMLYKTSFRISAWIAVFDILISMTFIIRLFNNFMKTRSQMGLRVLLWMNYLSALTFMFLTVCIVIQLQLTVLLNCKRLARKLDKFYEVTSILLAVVLTHPFLYYFNVKWDQQYQSIFSINTWKTPAIWGFFHTWMLLGWFYCVLICLWIVLRLMPVWRRMQNVSMFSFLSMEVNEYYDGNREDSSINSGSSNSNNDRSTEAGKSTSVIHNYEHALKPHQAQASPAISSAINLKGFPLSPGKHQKSTIQGYKMNRKFSSVAGPERRRHARNAILRIMLYPLIPIITRSIYIVTQIFPVKKSPFIPITILISSQGLLNFIVFCLNPALDSFWAQMFTSFKNSGAYLWARRCPILGKFSSSSSSGRRGKAPGVRGNRDSEFGDNVAMEADSGGGYRRRFSSLMKGRKNKRRVSEDSSTNSSDSRKNDNVIQRYDHEELYEISEFSPSTSRLVTSAKPANNNKLNPSEGYVAIELSDMSNSPTKSKLDGYQFPNYNNNNNPGTATNNVELAPTVRFNTIAQYEPLFNNNIQVYDDTNQQRLENHRMSSNTNNHIDKPDPPLT
ncbi:hypothetical protein H4219_003666 [Mycoemilia scoparia]|uniref:Uncharacterized protein n=1 Tax=Mycoemilia scoparia TaxID=417184 RepID=A0A9W7ZZV1_9FUNG|nr:hypothetical protein H4219_003666 [Mycoemilia scoparia]